MFLEVGTVSFSTVSSQGLEQRSVGYNLTADDAG